MNLKQRSSSIAIDENYALLFLQELIRIESVNPSLSSQGTGEYRIATYVGELMEYFGMEVSYQNIGGNRVNVIGELKGSGHGKSLILNGHLDTVGVEHMEIPPHEPEFKDGKIFGRGAIDMKSGIAAQVLAVKAIIDAGIKLKGNVVIACVADEEYMSKGTEIFLENYTADAAIVTEPTNMKVAIAHKGFVWSNIQFKGRAAHGSLPEEGVDAIMKAGKFLAVLDQWEHKHLPKITHPLLGRGSVHASTISGGTAISIYPDACILEVERRTLPGENATSVQAELGHMLEHLRGLDKHFSYTLDTYFERPPLKTSENEDISLALKKAFLQSTNEEAEIIGLNFWTDGALLSQAGIPTVVFGPTGEGLHAAVEYVEFDSVIQCAEILAQTVIDFCGT